MSTLTKVFHSEFHFIHISFGVWTNHILRLLYSIRDRMYSRKAGKRTSNIKISEYREGKAGMNSGEIERSDRSPNQVMIFHSFIKIAWSNVKRSTSF